MIDRDDGQDASDARYDLGEWDEDGVAELTATGQNDERALAAALAAVLAVGRGGRAALPPEPESAAAAAAAIRGQGADLAAVFAELAADLLAQLDANGPGFDQVRLDGLLRTDDGYSAWGYLLGEPVTDPPAVGLSLDGDPSVESGEGRVTIRCRLRR